MGAVDPSDDTIDRWIVCRYAFDSDRNERRHRIVGAFDGEDEFMEAIRDESEHLERLKAEGGAEEREHITGRHLAPGYVQRMANDRMARRRARSRRS